MKSRGLLGKIVPGIGAVAVMAASGASGAPITYTSDEICYLDNVCFTGSVEIDGSSAVSRISSGGDSKTFKALISDGSVFSVQSPHSSSNTVRALVNPDGGIMIISEFGHNGASYWGSFNMDLSSDEVFEGFSLEDMRYVNGAGASVLGIPVPKFVSRVSEPGALGTYVAVAGILAAYGTRRRRKTEAPVKINEKDGMSVSFSEK